MPTERFRSKNAYRKWNAYRHIHGIRAPHLKSVIIEGHKHLVKHTHLKGLGLDDVRINEYSKRRKRYK